jgi:probable HAF family extracellular repeat protein
MRIVPSVDLVTAAFTRPIVLLAMVVMPVLGCADRATAPAPIPSRTAQFARNPQALVPVDLGTLGGLSTDRSSEAHAINPSGDIVGWSTPTLTFGLFRVHAVLWRDGEIIDLGTLGGDLSRAWGISPSGVVVGAALTPDNFSWHAFRWENGVMTELGPGFAFGISPDGRVVGKNQGSLIGGHAVLWENGATVDLGTLGGVTSVAYAINPSGVIVGSSRTTEGTEHAFVWRDGTMADLGTLGGARSVAYAINPRGDIVGSSTTAAGEEHAVLWQKNGDMVDLGPPGRTSVARGINASGQIVGYFSGTPFGGAFLWQNGVMTELPPVVLELPGEPPARGDAHAYAINASGDIVGDGRTFLMPHGALWTRK